LAFKKKEIIKKEEQKRRELEKLERRLKEEVDPYKIAEMKFTIPWLKEKLGDITEDERKKDVRNIITQFKPDIFEKLFMERDGTGKTKVREIINEILPDNEYRRELEELELKQIGEKYLSPEETLEIKFTHIWLEVKLGKLEEEERFEKIMKLYKSYPEEITKKFKEDKARQIISNLFPERKKISRGAGSFKVADRRD